jgi:hypothetical protein
MEEAMQKEDGKQEASGTQTGSITEKKDHETERRDEAEKKTNTTQYESAKRHGWGQWTTLERTQVVFTGLLTFFTILYALTTLWQFMYLVRKDRLDQRAWVGVQQPIIPELKVGKEASFGVVLINSGKTPARKVKFYTVARLVPGEQAVDMTYPLPSRKGFGIMSPGVPTNVFDPNTTLLMSGRDMEDIQNGRIAVHLFGKISYEDIFRQPHCLMFCYHLTQAMKIGDACGIYNDEIDTQCPD